MQGPAATMTSTSPGRRVALLTAVLGAMLLLPGLHAHHEAIFGPQSSVLISRKRFVSTQYDLVNEGRTPDTKGRSHIGVLSVGTSVGKRWSVMATVPFEAERAFDEQATGIQDAVLALRYSADLRNHESLMGVLTVEPPTGTLEHRAVGLGGGLIYGHEWGHWSLLTYGLGRTESSLEEGEKRGNRLFLGGGLGYETHDLPFSPQLGISWERTGRRREEGELIPESNSSALMIHPTLTKAVSESLQTFLVVSLPLVQRSGTEGWQRFRIAAGLIWAF